VLLLGDKEELSLEPVLSLKNLNLLTIKILKSGVRVLRAENITTYGRLISDIVMVMILCGISTNALSVTNKMIIVSFGIHNILYYLVDLVNVDFIRKKK
jgi:O-glycosyl hydrolase